MNATIAKRTLAALWVPLSWAVLMMGGFANIALLMIWRRGDDEIRWELAPFPTSLVGLANAALLLWGSLHGWDSDTLYWMWSAGGMAWVVAFALAGGASIVIHNVWQDIKSGPSTR